MVDLERRQIESRVEMLIKGSADPRHLDAIFCWCRFRFHGHRWVRAIGDIAYHWEDNDQGRAVTDVANLSDSLKSLQYLFWSLLPELLPPKASKAQIEEICWATFELRAPNWFKLRFGMSRRRAKETLAAALGKVEGAAGVKSATRHGSNLILKVPLTSDEEKLTIALLHSSPEPNFTAREVTRQLAEVLVRNNIIAPRRRSRILALENFIGAWVIEKMHGRKLIMRERKEVPLYLGVYGEKPCLAVFGKFVVPLGDKEMEAWHPVFTTSCTPEEWTEPPLDPLRGGTLQVPIHFVAGKLAQLV